MPWYPGPYSHHIFSPAAIYRFYFLSLLLLFQFPLHLTFRKQQDGGIDNPSDSLGAKLVVFCVQVQVKQVSGAAASHLLVASGILLDLITSHFRVREICNYLHHNLPLWVTNEEVLSRPITCWWRYTPHWLPQVQGDDDVDSSNFSLTWECKVYRTHRIPETTSRWLTSNGANNLFGLDLYTRRN